MTNIRAIISVILLSILFSLTSCSDDTPVQPPETGFDSARYIWKVDTIPVHLFDIWAADTNEVYLLQLNQLICWNGELYKSYSLPPGFKAYIIGGFSHNNVVIGGTDVSGYLSIVIWDGLSFTEKRLTDTAQSYCFPKSILLTNQNNVWLGTTNGRVYNYVGSNTQVYYFDSLMYVGPFLSDAAQKIRFYGGIKYNHSIYDDSAKAFIYVFDSNDWTLEYFKRYTNLNQDTMLAVSNLNTEIIGLNTTGFFRYFPGQFTQFLGNSLFRNTPPFAGNSEDQFMTTGATNTEYDLFNWNGKKWSKENLKLEGPPDQKISYVNGNYWTYDYQSFIQSTIILHTTLNRKEKGKNILHY